MSTQANSIEAASAVSSAARFQKADMPVEAFTLACVGWFEDADFISEFHFSTSLPRLRDEVADFWEFVSYATLGLCALGLVGLCFS